MPAPLPAVLPADRQTVYGVGVHTAAHDLEETTTNALRTVVSDLSGQTVGEYVRSRDLYNPLDYGAKADAKRRGGVTSAGGGTSVTVPGAGFTAADVGKRIMVYTSDGFGTPRTIAAAVSATEVTLDGAAGFTATGAATHMAVWGTDDAAALNAALSAAGAAAGYDATLGDNLPNGAGHPTVVLPAVNEGGMIVASPVAVPDGVGFEGAAGVLYNLLASRTAVCMTIGRFTHIGELTWQLVGGGGLVCGTAAVQAHTYARRIALWNPGSTVTALELLGYHHEIGLFWVKGGNIGIYHNGASDDWVGEAYMVGPKVGAKMVGVNNIGYGHLRGDTVTGAQGVSGVLVVDDNSRNVNARIQAFIITAQTLDAVVAVGQNSTNKCHNLNFEVQAARTGGNVMRLANCAQSYFRIYASNHDVNSWGADITTGVSYGANVETNVRVEAHLPTTGVTPAAGTVAGNLRVVLDAAVRHSAAASGTTVLSGRVEGDTSSRWTIDAGGTLRWGPGNAAVDANLYRHAAGNALATDDDMRFPTIGTGPMIKSPDGTYYRITVANGGALSTVAV